MRAAGTRSGRRRNKKGVALVARAADTLLGRTALEVGTAGAALHGQIFTLFGRPRANPGSTLLRSRDDWGGSGLAGPGLALGLVVLLGWVAGALFATRVLALLANTVRTEGGLAAVAGTVNTHTDWLLNTLNVFVGDARGDPFVGLESQAVLGKEGASTLLLSSIARIRSLTDGGGDGLGFGGLCLGWADF